MQSEPVSPSKPKWEITKITNTQYKENISDLESRGIVLSIATVKNKYADQLQQLKCVLIDFHVLIILLAKLCFPMFSQKISVN